MPSPITSRSSTIGSRLHSCPSTGMYLFLLLDRVLIELVEVVNKFPRTEIIRGGGGGGREEDRRERRRREEREANEELGDRGGGDGRER
jgi:hypothetical protein